MSKGKCRQVKIFAQKTKLNWLLQLVERATRRAINRHSLSLINWRRELQLEIHISF